MRHISWSALYILNSDWLAHTRPLAGRIFQHPFFSSRLGWPISPDPKWPFSGTPTPTGYPGGVTFAPNMAQNRVRKSCSTNLSRRKIFKFLLAGEWFWGNYQPQIIKKCHIPRFRGRWAVSFRAFFKIFQIHFWPPKQPKMYFPWKFYIKTLKNAHLSFSGRQNIPAGCKAGTTSPNAQLAENGPKNLKMYLPMNSRGGPPLLGLYVDGVRL